MSLKDAFIVREAAPLLGDGNSSVNLSEFNEHLEAAYSELRRIKDLWPKRNPNPGSPPSREVTVLSDALTMLLRVHNELNNMFNSERASNATVDVTPSTAMQNITKEARATGPMGSTLSKSGYQEDYLSEQLAVELPQWSWEDLISGIFGGNIEHAKQAAYEVEQRIKEKYNIVLNIKEQ